MTKNKSEQWAILSYQRKPFHLPLQQVIQSKTTNNYRQVINSTAAGAVCKLLQTINLKQDVFGFPR